MLCESMRAIEATAWPAARENRRLAEEGAITIAARRATMNPPSAGCGAAREKLEHREPPPDPSRFARFARGPRARSQASGCRQRRPRAKGQRRSQGQRRRGIQAPVLPDPPIGRNRRLASRSVVRGSNPLARGANATILRSARAAIRSTSRGLSSVRAFGGRTIMRCSRIHPWIEFLLRRTDRA